MQLWRTFFEFRIIRIWQSNCDAMSNPLYSIPYYEQYKKKARVDPKSCSKPLSHQWKTILTNLQVPIHTSTLPLPAANRPLVCLIAGRCQHCQRKWCLLPASVKAETLKWELNAVFLCSFGDSMTAEQSRTAKHSNNNYWAFMRVEFEWVCVSFNLASTALFSFISEMRSTLHHNIQIIQL